jgi:hypothetical protein
VVVLLTLASYLAGWLVGIPALMPFLNAAGAWWMMVRELRAGRVTRAIAIMLVWAATMAVVATVIAAAGWNGSGGRDLFLQSDYREQMLAWVRTGVGPESQPSVFIPRHLGYAAVFAVAALVTGGLLAMPMGAMLMNSMGDYVGTMTGASAHPVASALLGWHPWAVVRIVGFVILGVVLSGPLVARVSGMRFDLRAQRGWIGVGAGLLALDILLKAVLAPWWGRLLRGLAGW